MMLILFGSVLTAYLIVLWFNAIFKVCADIFGNESFGIAVSNIELGDCPLADAKVIERLIDEENIEVPKANVLINSSYRTFPRLTTA